MITLPAWWGSERPYKIIDVLEGLKQIPDESIHCVVTSPPYWGLRSYLKDNDPLKAQEIGGEKHPKEYVAHLVVIFREIRRVLRKDGVAWLNLGDSYIGGGRAGKGKHAFGGLEMNRSNGAVRYGLPTGKVEGFKPKDLAGIPWRTAIALQDDGWWLRSDIVWAKGNVLPESCTDRPTKSHEYIFLLSKSEKYFYDAESIKEPALSSNVHDLTGSGYLAPGQTPQTGNRPGNSGNIKRKIGEDRDRPGSHLGNSIPWKGYTRNKRDVWNINTSPFQGDHYACFPLEIPTTCIKAGTSEKGCCSKCGSPWRRDIKRNNPSKAANAGHVDRSGGAANTANPQTSKGLKRNGGGVYSSAQDLGWIPTCDCQAEIVPCVVLDPFVGKGTTILAARQLGRIGLGFDLDPKNEKLIKKYSCGDASYIDEFVEE